MYKLWHKGPSTDWAQLQEEFPTKAYGIAHAQAYKLMGYRGGYAVVKSSKLPDVVDVDCSTNDISNGRLVTDAAALIEIAKQVSKDDAWLQISILHHIFVRLQGYAPN